MDGWFTTGMIIGGIILFLHWIIKKETTGKKSTTRVIPPETDEGPDLEESFNIDGNQFRIRYEPITKGIRPRALKYPPIPDTKNRSRKVTATHVYSDGRISTTTPPKTLEKAKAIARYWATGYVAYIKTGVFPNDGGRVKV